MRIAVVVTRQIGDVLLTTPLLAAIRQRWPEAAVDVYGFPGTLGVLDGNPDVARCIEWPRRSGWRAELRFAASAWRRCDIAFVAEASDRAHLLGFVLAPLRAGLVPERRGHAWWKRLLVRHAVEAAGDRSGRHVADEKLALLAPWRLAPPTLPKAATALVPPPAAGLPADLQEVARADPVVVHAPSSWPYKQWPVERYAELARALIDEGHRVVLTGSAEPRDRAIVAAIVARVASPRLVDACGRLDFRQLRGLLDGAALYIGPDGSVTHLAAACGTPVVALFGPTDPRRWGPIGPEEAGRRFLRIDATVQRRGDVALLQGAAAGACVPCGRAGCDDHRHSRSACLEAIDVGRVLAEARRALGRGTKAPLAAHAVRAAEAAEAADVAASDRPAACAATLP